MDSLGINIQVGSRFGWGIVALNLVLELCREGRIHPILTLPPGELDLDPDTEKLLARAEQGWPSIMEFNEKYPDQSFIVDFPMLYCGGNQFQHRFSVGTARERYSITVFENSFLGERSPEEKSFFHRIMAGSCWNAEILNAQGFQNVEVWNQGVDINLFSPGPGVGRHPGKFLVFSGGKLEFRKGQDLVIAAFRIFQENHPDAMLVTAWDSPWMQLASTFKQSPWIAPPEGASEGRIDILKWLAAEGIPPERVVNLGSVPNCNKPSFLWECDVAVFPSRAEGATNLVAMEAIACGIPSILSANTGHLDLLADIPLMALKSQASIANVDPRDGMQGWGESEVEEIVEKLEMVHADREVARRKAKDASEAIQSRAWSKRVAALMKSLVG